MAHRPRISETESDRIRAWHERAYAEMQRRGACDVEYLGRRFHVPASVFGPTPTSDLLGRAVLDETRPDDRVLDMGTGCGVNAILAAARATDVVGVDINPDAVIAATENARRNEVADRTTFRESDVFRAVDGSFDLMIIDPPFRWFAPRDALEASITDEAYRMFGRFIRGARSRLRSSGRILLFFGTSGDFDYIVDSIAEHGWHRETVATRDLTLRGTTTTYETMRLTVAT